MNNSRQPFAKSKSSESGTRSKVAAKGTTATPVDDEIGAFFDRGDVGDYEGGVAFTQPPASLEPIITDESYVVRISQQAARRALFTKVVTSVVAGCATLMLVAMGYNAWSQRETTENRAETHGPLPTHGNAAASVPAVEHLPIENQVADIRHLAPPPPPPDSLQPPTEQTPDSTVASPDSKFVEQPTPEPKHAVVVPPAASSTVKKSPLVATAPSAHVARMGRIVPKSAAGEHRSTASVKQRSQPTVAASAPIPAPQVKPSFAAFPVD